MYDAYREPIALIQIRAPGFWAADRTTVSSFRAAAIMNKVTDAVQLRRLEIIPTSYLGYVRYRAGYKICTDGSAGE